MAGKLDKRTAHKILKDIESEFEEFKSNGVPMFAIPVSKFIAIKYKYAA